MAMAFIDRNKQTVVTPQGVTLHQKLPTTVKNHEAETPWGFLRASARLGKNRNDPLARQAMLKCYSTVEKAAMNEANGLQGGYIVPQDYSLALLEALDANSIIRPRALVIPMASAETLLPKVNIETAQSAGTAPYFGGMLYTWGEGGSGTSPTVAETEPTFGQISLKAWSLIGVSIVSNQLLMDIGDVGEQKLIQLFGRAAAWYEESAFFAGVGADKQQPIGILNASGSTSVNRQITNHITISDVTGMAAKLMPFSWAHSIWCCSPSALIDVMKIQGYVPNQDSASAEHGSAGTLMSRPLYATDNLPALGTKGDLVFIDPSLYVIGHRQDIVIDSSPHPQFQNYQTVFRVWLRVDGKPALEAGITLADGTSTASAFVLLN